MALTDQSLVRYLLKAQMPLAGELIERNPILRYLGLRVQMLFHHNCRLSVNIMD